MSERPYASKELTEHKMALAQESKPLILQALTVLKYIEQRAPLKVTESMVGAVTIFPIMEIDFHGIVNGGFSFPPTDDHFKQLLIYKLPKKEDGVHRFDVDCMNLDPAAGLPNNGLLERVVHVPLQQLPAEVLRLSKTYFNLNTEKA